MNLAKMGLAAAAWVAVATATLAAVPAAAGAAEAGGWGAVKLSPMDRDSLVVQLSQQPPPMDPAYRSLIEFERQIFRRDNRPLPPVVSVYNRFGVVHAEFATPAAREAFESQKIPGVFVFSRFDRFADLFLESVDALEKLERCPQLLWINLGDMAKVPDPNVISIRQASPPADAGSGSGQAPAPPASSQEPEDVLRGGDRRVDGLTGKGVVIVIIDTGLDFRNWDFIDPGTGRSRVLYYWDTVIYMDPRYAPGTEAPPLRAPNGQHMGIVYTQEALSKDIREKMRTVPLYDIHGHGTSCAGVAAANGTNARNNPAAAGIRTPLTGAAPQAELIIVRIAWLRDMQCGFLLGSIIDWVEAKSRTDPRLRGKPIVYSCSWGGDNGDHAGNQVLERQLDARFAPDTPGRALCVAAGNNGWNAHHGRARLEGGTYRIAWTLEGKSGGQSEAQSFTLFYGGQGQPGDIEVDYVGPETLQDPRREQIRRAVIQDIRAKTFRHGLTGEVITDARWLLPPGRQELRIRVKPGSGLSPEDVYIEPRNNSKVQFDEQTRQYGKQIGFPSGARHALCVGSYDWNRQTFSPRKELVEAPLKVGELSAYSNPGPVRAGDAVKPDIVAPGQHWLVSEPDPRQLAGFRQYKSFNGTSAATPYVAGIVALMLEKKPALTVGQIRQLLAAHATRGEDKLLPANRRCGWGNGKLDHDAVQRILQALR